MRRRFWILGACALLVGMGVLWGGLEPDTKAPAGPNKRSSARRTTQRMRLPGVKKRDPQVDDVPALPSKVERPVIQHELCLRDPQGEPAAGRRIRLYCSDTSAALGNAARVTDAQGCVQVELCPRPDTVTCVRLSDLIYRAPKAWVIEPGDPSSEFELAPPAKVWGRVETASGKPIAGAQIWFQAQDPDPMSAPPFVQSTLVSDMQGAFSFLAALPAPCDPCVRDEQACELERRSEYAQAPPSGEIWIRHSQHPLTRVAMPQDWGELSSIVLDDAVASLSGQLTGRGADGALLMLRHLRHRQDRQSTRADADGNFRFVGLGDGDYELSVFVGGKPVMQRAPVRVDDKVRLELEGRER